MGYKIGDKNYKKKYKNKKHTYLCIYQNTLISAFIPSRFILPSGEQLWL